MTARLAPRACPWAELPPELLGDVSSRLYDAGDFVRLHAVCRPWYDALLSHATRTIFLPWIVAPYDKKILHSVVNFTPSSSYRHRSRNNIVLAEPPGASSTAGERNWVARADGTAAWLFTWSPEPGLTHLVTGAITPLPGFPDDDETKLSMDKPRGIVYDDGTIFLYAFTDDCTENGIDRYLTVAIWRPGDAEWTFMVHRVPLLGSYHLGYHHNKVIVTHGRAKYWCVLLPDFEGNDHMFVEAWNTIDETKYMLDYSYILESRGELICVSVLVDRKFYPCADDNPVSHAFSVIVHALEEVNGGGEMGWVERDNLSFGDRVLFLGCPASFAADAAQLGMGGGCVVFTYGRSVFKYSLLDGEAQLLMRQRPGWSIDRTCVWLQPQRPTVAPIQQIRERLARRTIQEKEK